ncbi:hypothetical protein N7456_010327 [Penicillium angulare]|uniref:SMP domain-containing protein n=1 Tax=Penicillium angulare TaxID=116970 RepID=A0A9W9F6L8_9EURO|nr:hypothetical protein N7456_010327 [Penicillium angulare]
MSHQMSKSDAARIQSGQAKSGGDMSSGGFAARAQGAADRHAHAAQGSQPSNNSGGNAGAGKGGSAGSSNTGAQGKR